ncbi:MAG: xanthine dehydrogenase family protein molybdopterin-binding subunit [Nitrospinota bacterium]
MCPSEANAPIGPGVEPVIVGGSPPKTDAIDKAAGAALYADDYREPGQFHVMALRSPHAHARILRIDTSKARRLPGVADIVTAADIPGQNRVGITVLDRPVLAEGKVRFVGEAVAAVAAETAWRAEQAAAAIEVEYEPLPGVFDPEEALREGAPILHEDRPQGNLLTEWRVSRGDVEAAFRSAAVMAEDVFQTQPIEHAYLEPESGLAFLDERGRVVLHTCCQSPYGFRSEIARVLGCEPDRIRVLQTATGGGFGGKLEISLQAILAFLALRLKRQVQWTFSMEESYLSTSKRHPLKMRCKMGADGQGRLVALEMDVLGNCGPYGGSSVAVVARTAVHATGPYFIPNVRTRSRSVYTNNPIQGGQMRGFGIPQCAFALEQQMDVLADRLGIDPLEFRRRNVLEVGMDTATGQRLEASVGMGASLDALRPAYQRMLARASAESTKGRRLGVGMGGMWYGIGKTGMPNASAIRVEIESDGRVLLYSDCADIGQGSDMVLRMICAETLGVPLDSVRLHVPDTDTTPNSGSTCASRQTYITGQAVHRASQDALDKLLRKAADHLEVPVDLVRWEADRVLVSTHPERCLSLQALNAGGKTVIAGEGEYNPETTPLDQRTGSGNPYRTYAFGAQVALVEVDTHLGQVQVVEMCAAHDVGKPIHRINTEGQIDGGVAMGVGQALMEEYVHLRTPSLTEYLLPTSVDVPEVTSLLVEDPEPTGPFGAKGVGEPAMIPTLAAIANAVYRATGVRVRNLPISPLLIAAAVKGQDGR